MMQFTIRTILAKSSLHISFMNTCICLFYALINIYIIITYFILLHYYLFKRFLNRTNDFLNRTNEFLNHSNEFLSRMKDFFLPSP